MHYVLMSFAQLIYLADCTAAWWAWQREPKAHSIRDAGVAVGISPAADEKPAAFKHRLRVKLRAPVDRF